MKKAKKIASLVVASALLTSSFAAYASVNAAEIPSAQTAASDSSLRDNVGDGVMLHAFNWSYNSIKENLPAIAAAGYTTVQTSPVQQPKDFTTSNDVAGQWWKLYQPVSLKIAEKSWLGTKAELKSLCDEADKYGIKIICDIVSNHLGNEVETDPNSVSTQVQTYQPDIYAGKDKYFHSYKGDASDSSTQAVVQGHVSKCPDLNTGDSYVQNAVVSLLKDCIDCGVDGFRFDAAKHIETPDDGSYASSYWKTISEQASSYYTAKTGKNLYIYGEILNNCGAGRSYSSYTKYINVTDNTTGDNVLASVTRGNAANAANARYRSGSNASDVVLWAESHDTYEGTSGSAGIANTASVSDENIVKAWAIVASRKDSTALYFARPGAALMGDAATDTTYKGTAVSEINKFHNLFVGQSEKLGSSDSVAYVARGTSGIVLSNCSGTNKTVSISGTGLADGSYTDTISGAKFTVSGGVLTGSIGSTGVAVVYKGTTTPRNTCSVESGSFTDDTMTVTLGLDNATSGTYCLDNSTPVKYTGTTTIRIGSDYKVGETINLTLTATDGTKQTSAVYKYEKKSAASSGVYVFFNSARKTTWKAPFSIYIYDEDTDAKKMTYSNANWPGATMDYDAATGYYYYEVSSTTCLGKDADGNVSETTFDLAHSPNTYVIIVDSKGNQYPGATAKSKIKLQGSSKMYALTKTNSWEDTTLVPTPTVVEATDVTKGTVAEPTTQKPSTQPTTQKPSTQPTTQKPSTQPSTAATDPTTTAPIGSRIYGDANGDGKITIADTTTVIRDIVGLKTLPDNMKVIADVNSDNTISIADATCIQKYVVGFTTGYGLTGKVYEDVQPTTAQPATAKPTTQPTTVKPTTQPTTAQPTTAPAPQTYTLYFKTTLGWMTDDGVSLFAYDLGSGTSYQLERDEDAYPYVYTAEVPKSVTNVTVYRFLEEIDETPVGGEGGNVYNCWTAKGLSSSKNCITLSNDEVVSTGAYVPEQAPSFTLSRVYFDNSKANYKDVYIYGWAESGLGNAAAHMTHIAGTSIWYYDFDTPLNPGAKCFLFKDTETTWNTQTNDMTVVDGKNCFRANPGSKSGGSWYSYTE